MAQEAINLTRKVVNVITDAEGNETGDTNVTFDQRSTTKNYNVTVDQPTSITYDTTRFSTTYSGDNGSASYTVQNDGMYRISVVNGPGFSADQITIQVDGSTVAETFDEVSLAHAQLLENGQTISVSVSGGDGGEIDVLEATQGVVVDIETQGKVYLPPHDVTVTQN